MIFERANSMSQEYFIYKYQSDLPEIKMQFLKARALHPNHFNSLNSAHNTSESVNLRIIQGCLNLINKCLTSLQNMLYKTFTFQF